MNVIFRSGCIATCLSLALWSGGCASNSTDRSTNGRTVSSTTRKAVTEFKVVQSSTERELTPKELELLREEVGRFLQTQGLGAPGEYLVRVDLPAANPGEPAEWVLVKVTNMPAATYTVIAAYPLMGSDDYYYPYATSYDYGYTPYGYYSAPLNHYDYRNRRDGRDSDRGRDNARPDGPTPARRGNRVDNDGTEYHPAPGKTDDDNRRPANRPRLPANRPAWWPKEKPADTDRPNPTFNHSPVHPAPSYAPAPTQPIDHASRPHSNRQDGPRAPAPSGVSDRGSARAESPHPSVERYGHTIPSTPAPAPNARQSTAETRKPAETDKSSDRSRNKLEN